ncbi:hypothetical protein A5757_18095 [Mycobacterium sp. 852013-51886_SCH5428379]|uniref:DUF5642 family protein n=1 Tax=Mycobacterium sp. 852013-51886_SCH5428379 TaxID=1834111 RepID=UPI0007FBD4D3|nr:DUF5642 family protein [Mycobacterium sp. 852013-51886_SCH5428379]OBB57758.1 hypothetical protein A5757_18095 [Mycobacterium sp. 852013-51886_SCH5428379]
MRHIAAVGVAATVLAACGAPSDESAPETPSSAAAPTGDIDPTRIDRARYALPPGYEVTGVSGRVTPVAQWGFGPEWRAEPDRCAALSDPAVDPATLRGWSASGAGGIVYAVAATGASGIDPARVGECATWQISAGPSTGTARLVAAPAVAGAQTVAMAAESLTVVEGGTETRSEATTAMAAQDGRLVYVTVVTDPGSPNPVLDGRFAAELLAETVTALRK